MNDQTRTEEQKPPARKTAAQAMRILKSRLEKAEGKRAEALDDLERAQSAYDLAAAEVSAMMGLRASYRHEGFDTDPREND